ncbi:MAG: hypothetical protein EZS28_050617, partial [Streblomastix strix]
MIPKAVNKWSKILDCRRLNRAIAKQYFQTEDAITVIQIIKQKNYDTQLDLEKTYHHLTASKYLQGYIRFKFRRKAYHYMRLPFGWNRSPPLFIREMRKEIVRARQSQDNSIHKRAELEDAASQVLGNTNETLPIPQLEVEDLYDGSMHSPAQEKVIKIEKWKIFRDYDGEDGSGIRRIEKLQDELNFLRLSFRIIRMEWEVEVGQKNVVGSEMVGLDDQGQYSKNVPIENTYNQSNNRYGDNMMGSGIGGYRRGEGVGDESLGVEQYLKFEVFKLMKDSCK